MPQQIIARKEAKAQGLKCYFTGIPCNHGHSSGIYVSSNQCKECHLTRRHNEYYANSQKEIQKTRLWELNNPEKLKILRRNKRRPETICGLSLSEYLKAWKVSNKDKVKANHNKRRALKNNCEGFFTDEGIALLYFLQDGKCIGCQRQFLNIKYTIDHIFPLSKGGSNWLDNIQLLCGKCNSSKHAKLMQEWIN